MTQPQKAGAVAVANEEAVRAWDTVLYERWKTNRKVFVGALDEVAEDLFARFPPPEGGHCIDIGCGFGETTQRPAQFVGPQGFALGTDSSPHFVSDARQEAADAGVSNVAFGTSDAQTAEWDQIYDYAFSRRGTRFFAAPVPAMRAIRRALKPGGVLRKVCWRRKSDSRFWAETEQVVQRFLTRPEEYEADTCGPGPFSLDNPETTRGILEAAAARSPRPWPSTTPRGSRPTARSSATPPSGSSARRIPVSAASLSAGHREATLGHVPSESVDPQR